MVAGCRIQFHLSGSYLAFFVNLLWKMELGLNLDSKVESKTLKSGKYWEKQSITSMVSRLNMRMIFSLDCPIYNFEKVFPSHFYSHCRALNDDFSHHSWVTSANLYRSRTTLNTCRMRGLEPLRPFENQYLKPACLPFRHSREKKPDATYPLATTQQWPCY